jgi:DnaK suppressor protein
LATDELYHRMNHSEMSRIDKVHPMPRTDALHTLRETLLSRRDALRRALAGDLGLLSEVRGQCSGDVIDAALDSAQDELSSQLAEVESRELASIENALERMREGDYGHCEHCTEAIPLARLQALPYATLCIKCQRKAEKNGTAPGGPRDWKRMLDSVSDEAEADVEVDV